MAYNVVAIRELVGAALSDEELSIFCFDYFPAVYQQFTTGQTKGTRVRMLVEHAQQQRRLDELLTHIQKANPRVYDEFAPRLTTALPAQAGTQQPGRLRVIVLLAAGVLVAIMGIRYVAAWPDGQQTALPQQTAAAAAPTATLLPSPYLTEAPPATAQASPATPTPKPVYQSGLITYWIQDENGKSLHALATDGSPITLGPPAKDAMILSVSRDREYLAIAFSQTGVLTRSGSLAYNLNPRFIMTSEGSTMSLVVVSSDGQKSTPVIDGVAWIDARYTADGQLLVAILEETVVTYLVARTDGSEPRELYKSNNIFTTRTPAQNSTTEAAN